MLGLRFGLLRGLLRLRFGLLGLLRGPLLGPDHRQDTGIVRGALFGGAGFWLRLRLRLRQHDAILFAQLTSANFVGLGRGGNNTSAVGAASGFLLFFMELIALTVGGGHRFGDALSGGVFADQAGHRILHGKRASTNALATRGLHKNSGAQRLAGVVYIRLAGAGFRSLFAEGRQNAGFGAGPVPPAAQLFATLAALRTRAAIILPLQIQHERADQRGQDANEDQNHRIVLAALHVPAQLNRWNSAVGR